MKLGHTDIEPANKRFAEIHARNLFFKALWENAFEVFEELANINFSVDSFPVHRWAKGRNLEADWIIESAFELHLLIKEFPYHLEEICRLPPPNIAYVSWEMINESSLPPPPHLLPMWKADCEPRADYIQRIDDLIDLELANGFFSDSNNKGFLKKEKLELVEKYCDENVKVYLNLKDEIGKHLWIPTQEKTNLNRNAIWAVKFQVCGNNYSDLAIEESCEHTTVKRATDAFFELLNLKPRQIQRGRSKGQTMQKIKAKRFERYAQS